MGEDCFEPVQRSKLTEYRNEVLQRRSAAGLDAGEGGPADPSSFSELLLGDVAPCAGSGDAPTEFVKESGVGHTSKTHEYTLSRMFFLVR